MKYTREERIDIGRRVYTKELSRREAMIEYTVCRNSVLRYVNLYKESAGISTSPNSRSPSVRGASPELDISTYQEMTKDELINELIKSKINEARAKKGYEVKGDGSKKEFISIKDKNSKS